VREKTVTAEAGAFHSVTLYRFAALFGAVSFAMVGLVFLAMPDGVLAFFNKLSEPLGLPPSPLQGRGFYLALAAGYMYLVTVLAVLMFRHPRSRIFPFLLAHGKLASAILSAVLFLTHRPFLMYASNSVVDGLIGAAALACYFRMGREPE
jgi:hypothetical protein